MVNGPPRSEILRVSSFYYRLPLKEMNLEIVTAKPLRNELRSTERAGAGQLLGRLCQVGVPK